MNSQTFDILYLVKTRLSKNKQAIKGERRVRKKVVLSVLITSLVFGVVGCSKTDKQETPDKPTVTEAPSPSEATKGIYTAGTYSASAQGFGGEINVTVTVDENKITEIKAEGAKETAGIGDKAIEQLSAKMVEENKAEVDTVTGATYSSKGLIAAVETALSLARGEEQAEKKVTDGKYVIDVVGHEGLITVATLFVDETIKSVEVVSQNETQGIGTYATARMPGKIVEAQSINIDGISGATITSNAIKQAVVQAVEKAGGDVAKYNVEPVKEEVVKKEIEENVQVAIMGAGTSGLFAAARLLDMGVKDVILFEKQDIPGGSMPTTYGGLVISDSEIYNNWGLGSPMFGSWESLGAAFLGMSDPNAPGFNKELPFTKAVFTKAGELYDWMANIGVGFTTLGSRSGYSYPYFAPGCYQGGTGYAMEFLVKRIEAKGGRIIYATPVTDLKQDETGRITGLVAEGEDGTVWNVNADAVLLASGSFAKNEELINKYFPEWSGSYFNAPVSLTGDGLILGMKYGAGIEGMGGHMPGFLASYDTHFELAFMHLTTPGIIVNVDGNQFGNIMKNNHSMMAAAKADPVNGDTFYYIFDDAAAAMTCNNEAYGFDAYKAIFEKGEAKKYDSLEECAKQLNLPNLAETVKKNNELALTGEKNEWGRDKLPYIETSSGVWAIRVDPNVYLTTGGLKIDTSAHVLSEDGKVIPGLYAAGDVCGSVEQKDGRNYAYGFDSAMSFGAIAAETMMEEIK